MDKSSSPISFDNAKCSSCSELVCVGVCPQGLIEINRENKLCITDISSCTFCGVCTNLCPSKAISIDSSIIVKKNSPVSE
jgi:Fe-S-cluster-containing hydrogenase component 2